MVQLFQRYVPYSSIVDFLVQSLLCLTAFTLSVQLAFHFHLAPSLPALAGVRAGRTLTTVSVLVMVFYLTGYFERRNHFSLSRFVPRLLHAVPLTAVTLFCMYAFVPAVALPWQVAGSRGQDTLLSQRVGTGLPTAIQNVSTSTSSGRYTATSCVWCAELCPGTRVASTWAGSAECSRRSPSCA